MGPTGTAAGVVDGCGDLGGLVSEVTSLDTWSI